MARFYLDEDTSGELAALLRTAGHDVLTTEEAGLRATPDSDQLLRAWAEQRILVTHNSKHFFMLHHAWTSWPEAWNVAQIPQHSGIVIILQPPRAAGQIIERLFRSRSGRNSREHPGR